MDEKTFNEGLKLLKRFLKEKGIYQRIFVNYLFRNNRPINNLFEEFNSEIWNDVDDWGVLFNKVNLLVGQGNNFDGNEWTTLIHNQNIDKDWEQFYREWIRKNSRKDLNSSKDS
jgi:hypothetical protein